jgi:hypothetical protein
MSFEISPDINKNKIFLVNHSELDERYDPSYYLPYLTQITYAYETKKLNKLAKLIMHPPEHRQFKDEMQRLEIFA